MQTLLEFESHRSPVVSRYGIAAASQPLAVAAGLSMLRQGGTAADAAVAIAAGLNVTEPGSTGLGGDAFALFFDAKTRTVSALNGSGRAPRALTLERLHREGFEKDLPPTHPYAITVPGACAAWFDIIERFGRLPMATILAPAIKLAEEGFPVAPLTGVGWQRAAQYLLSRTLNGLELTIDGKGPGPGEIFHNPGLARTMRAIAEGGKDAYYKGKIAEGIVDIIREAGGCMTLEDLAAHHSTWEKPISINYHGIRVYECPPNGQGLAALLALNILEGFDLASLPALSTERLHLEIEAMRLGFSDARYFVADPAFNPAPLDELLSKEYAAERRKLIDPHRAQPVVTHGLPGGHDTVYFSVVDGEGNACSFINSNYQGFGTGIVPRGWGFSLQNRGNGFSLDPTHPNVVHPGKRPYHTIIPAMATYEKDGALFASYGVMGGFMQPQGHMQVTVAQIDDRLDPQASLDRPRFSIEPNSPSSRVSLELGIPDRVMASLAEMGHSVTPIAGLARSMFGRGQIIQRDPQTGVLWGGSDPRADGCAMTLIP
jgi:gamma-glutamyltranspeptidase / glutathione hydrolase